jgi:uncharacterized membrane protein YgcG
MKIALAPQIVAQLRAEAEAYCAGYKAAIDNIITVRTQEPPKETPNGDQPSNAPQSAE